MKNVAYLSFVLAVVLLVISFVGSFIELDNTNLFLYGGIGTLLLVSMPCFILERYAYNKTKNEILKEFKNDHKSHDAATTKKSKNLNYPSFRKQKSGLTWGGGNIHASSAKRGSKKGFLRN